MPPCPHPQCKSASNCGQDIHTPRDADADAAAANTAQLTSLKTMKSPGWAIACKSSMAWDQTNQHSVSCTVPQKSAVNSAPCLPLVCPHLLQFGGVHVRHGVCRHRSAVAHAALSEKATQHVFFPSQGSAINQRASPDMCNPLSNMPHCPEVSAHLENVDGV